MRGLASRLLFALALLMALPVTAASQDNLPRVRATDSQRTIIGDVLAIASTPASLAEGEYYLITFKTGAPGADMPEKLRQRFPQTMTVILQHDYAVVDVTDQTFTLALHFDDVLTPVTIPFAGVTEFSHPRMGLILYWDGVPPVPGLPQKL